MYSRKVIDEIKVKKLWWLKPEQRARMRKNRKQCSCWMCGNPRMWGNGKEAMPIKEQALRFLHQDEITEYIISTQFYPEDVYYGD